MTGGITAPGGGAAFGFPGPMSDSVPLLLCLIVISACAVTMTVTMVWTTRDVRRTLRRVNTVLPSADRALREVHRALDHVRRMLMRADQASRRVESVVQQACDTAQDAVQRFSALKEQARHSLGKWLGNEAGADPRRHHRNGRNQ